MVVMPAMDASHLAVKAVGVVPSPTTLTWLRADASHPAAVYVGGYSGTPATCVDPITSHIECKLWSAGSADAGGHWRSLVPGLARVDGDYANLSLGEARCADNREPFVVSPAAHDLYVFKHFECSASHAYSQLFRSPDGGSRWYDASRDIDLVIWGPSLRGDLFTVALAISPSMPRRVYLTGYPAGGGGYALYVLRSDDAGIHWRVVSDVVQIDGEPPGTYIPVDIVADPSTASVAYLGLALTVNGAPEDVPVAWARSEDGGATWHFLTPPAGPVFRLYSTLPGPPYTSLTLATDPHLPGRIVAQLTGTGIPADRRYVSADHGRTWKTIDCPGDLHGQCPAYTLDNVFGAGHAYGFYRDGVHAFSGAGPAGSKLPLSDRLPCRTSALIDVGGGQAAGAPAYLLCQDPAVALATPPVGFTWTLDQNPNLSGILYRSTDGGRSWQRLHPASS